MVIKLFILKICYTYCSAKIISEVINDGCLHLTKEDAKQTFKAILTQRKASHESYRHFTYDNEKATNAMRSARKFGLGFCNSKLQPLGDFAWVFRSVPFLLRGGIVYVKSAKSSITLRV